MYMACRHIQTNGLRCGSPVLKDNQFCYYHSKIHTVGAEPHLRYGPLQLPAPEDSAAIQLSVARISDAIINERINLKKATALLYALQIAAQFIDRNESFDEDETVQSAELTVHGDELAPSRFACKEEDKCDDCPYFDLCIGGPDDDDDKEDADAGDGDEAKADVGGDDDDSERDPNLDAPDPAFGVGDRRDLNARSSESPAPTPDHPIYT
jgi:hypothetical protein